MFQDLDFKSFLMGANVGVGLELSKAKRNLDGKTADEIISEAEIVKKKLEAEQQERNQERKNQLKPQIKKLEKEKELANNIKNEIEKIKILYANFEAKNIRNFKSTDIYCSVQNNSKYTISSIAFIFEIVSDDRKVPWYTEKLYTTISGGLNPQENKDLELLSIRYWDREKYPSNVYLNVKIESLYDENKKRIYPSQNFNQYDQQKLERLKSEYESL